MDENIYEYDGAWRVPIAVSNVRIRDGLKTIPDRAFNDCRLLVSIYIPDSVETIGKWAFSGCRNLVSINLPSSIRRIGDGTFQDCMSLSSIHLPSSIKDIGHNAFYNCSSLLTVQLHSEIKIIRESTFQYCKYLTIILLPPSITNIDDGAFCGCEYLQSITLPPSLEYIGRRAFHRCKSLTLITLPSDIEFIGKEAFKGCNSLQTINLQSTINQSKKGNLIRPFKDIEISNNQMNQMQYKIDSVPLLHFLLMFGCVQYDKDEIGDLINLKPDSLTICDPIYFMYPFLLAACTPRNGHVYDDRKYDKKKHLETVFVLLRRAPWVIDILIPKKSYVKYQKTSYVIKKL